MSLVATNLVKHFPVRGSTDVVHALDDVSLTLEQGETLGIVGESGCGKSTLAKVLVRLEDATSGTVTLDGVDLTALKGAELRRQRRRIQMVFQDPYSSLNPRKSIGSTLEEVLVVHRFGANGDARRARVAELLDLVGLDPAFATRLPHELSGGQRQRIGIARALAVEPSVLILDEPVSALDVSVRAEVMNLLGDLQRRLGLSYIFISHDVSMVRQISDRVAVMYLGRIVELGAWKDVLDAPLHPYTEGLRASVPVPDPTVFQPITATVRGEVPNPVHPPAGCRFHPRCPAAVDACRTVLPLLTEVRPEHEVACHVAVAEGHLPDAARTV
ncbi:MAG: transporter ATP-binding protein [Microbacteriaceae bacterium]|jgi:oligopeptide/dipeptide ABC transporter ATP-binding protein|nr:transporter ATP-binding protein [Microbacteriaceae bacterium]